MNIFLPIVCILLSVQMSLAADPGIPETKCAPGAEQPQQSSGICADPGTAGIPSSTDGSLLLLIPPQSGQSRMSAKSPPVATAGKTGRPNEPRKKIILYFFWGKGCPHCEEEQKFLAEFKRGHPSLEIKDFEVWHNKENAGLLATMLQAHGMKSSGVPVTFLHDQVYTGFSAQTRILLEKTINDCSKVSCDNPGEWIQGKGGLEAAGKTRTFSAASSAAALKTGAESSVTIPLLGDLDARTSSLPLLTLLIAGMDSFNPCAFFVLLTLLGLLVHAQSRIKMLMIGGIFVFFSGFIYFLFMAAWLNLFLVMGHVAIITTIAGLVSVVIAGINIKDFFLYKQGVSLTIPDSAKPKLFDRMRKLLRSTSLAAILVAATVLAILANFYELLCTAGFPMVFTRILTLNNLSTATYYLYLVLYNIIYVIPLFIIVIGFTATLGKQQLSEWQGRVLKLVSGVMMLGLGATLLVNPALLSSIKVSFIIMLSSIVVSFLVATLTKKWSGTHKDSN